jgi:hypothetical protein
MSPMSMSEKTAENLWRRTLKRRGFILRKAGVRDRLAPDHGRYAVAVDHDGRELIVAGLDRDGRFCLTAAEVAAQLDQFNAERRAALIAAALKPRKE